MKYDNESKRDPVDEIVDSVLSNASPRAAPRKDRKEEIYGELRSEWLAGVSSQKRTQRYVISGVAASIVAALVLTLQLNIVSTDVSPDAVVVRLIGSGTTVNGRPVEESTPINAPLRFQQGDILSTGPDAAVAIAWNELGSLRVSSSSKVVIASNELVELLEGDIYFDSRSHSASGSATIIVDTPFGSVNHVGTQFAASVIRSGMHISVREGEVSFGGSTRNVVVRAGQSAFINDSRVATFSPISATDGAWSWATRIAPQLDVDGRSTREIIDWLSRETGRVVVYESPAAEEYARRDRIKGIGQVDPLRAMNIVPFASDLDFKVDQESIRVELKNQ